MKQLMVQYAAYNVWANQKILDCIDDLEDEQIFREISSSHKSIYLTMLQMLDIESIWWQRMKMHEPTHFPSADFKGSIMELTKLIIAQSKQWKEWIDIATDTILSHEFIYKTNKKDQFKQPVFEALHHLFNQQTFLRGQLTTMLYQSGSTPPEIDLILFVRKK